MSFEHPQLFRRKPCPNAEKRLQAEGITPLAARVLSARGVNNSDDIVPALRRLPPPSDLPGAESAACELAAAITASQKICVVGDYDVDGMTATAIAVDCLTFLGADVDWLIPRRCAGYGLSSALAEEAARRGANWILTVDNGICATSGIAKAQALGMKVCVSDHHRFGPKPPLADCIVHPALNKTVTPLSNLVGVGVVFYLMAALRARLNVDCDMSQYLDLTALGTIADCAPMDEVNRTLVGGGLRRLRAGAGRIGLMALTRRAKRDIGTLGTSDLGYALAPRLNAAGRLDNVDDAMQCLLADNETTADAAVRRLEKHNGQRIVLQNQALKELRATLPDTLPAGIVKFNDSWHLGVIGIVAGVISADTGRPTLVFAGTGDGHWRGSGRAPDGWDLFALIQEIDKNNPGLLLGFGGHAGAVGVNLEYSGEKHLEELFASACAAAKKPTKPGWEVDETPMTEEITKAAVCCK